MQIKADSKVAARCGGWAVVVEEGAFPGGVRFSRAGGVCKEGRGGGGDAVSVRRGNSLALI